MDSNLLHCVDKGFNNFGDNFHRIPIYCLKTMTPSRGRQSDLRALYYPGGFGLLSYALAVSWWPFLTLVGSPWLWWLRMALKMSNKIMTNLIRVLICLVIQDIWYSDWMALACSHLLWLSLDDHSWLWWVHPDSDDSWWFWKCQII